jgi:hypothetical protein
MCVGESVGRSVQLWLICRIDLPEALRMQG